MSNNLVKPSIRNSVKLSCLDIKFNNLLNKNEYLTIVDNNEIINGPKKYVIQYKYYDLYIR